MAAATTTNSSKSKVIVDVEVSKAGKLKSKLFGFLGVGTAGQAVYKPSMIPDDGHRLERCIGSSPWANFFSAQTPKRP